MRSIIATVRNFGRRFLPRGVGTLARASLISQLCTLLAMPVLTRWCSLSDFGLFQLYLTVTTISGLLACLRYDYAILQPADQTVAEGLGLLALLMALGAGCVTLGVLPLLTRSLGTTGWMELAKLTPLVAVAVTTIGMASATTQWLIRLGRFDGVARSRWVQSFSVATLQLAGAAAGWGGTALIAGDVAGRLVGLVMLMRADRLLQRMPTNRAGLARLLRLGREYLRFPAVAAPSALINSVGASLPVFFVERFFGPAGLGVFSVLERVMGVPTLFLGQPLSQTFIHRFREALTRGPKSTQAEVRFTVRIASWLGAAPFLALLLAGPILFVVVFGNRWQEAGHLSQMLSVPYFVSYALWPVMPTLIILDRLRTQMAWDTMRAISLFGLAVFASHAQLRLEAVVSMIVVLMSVFSVVNFWLCHASAGRSPALTPSGYRANS